ncbi:DinB family protein [Bacillus sp. T3]|uniref:DinB family protein n=1 Tax=Bacillus sp. T3 TaxID=467262 RepID=UPI00298281B8|nr:DinB family protein [Bacillus sp. T3]
MKNQLQPNEYAPYYQPYISLVPEGDIIQILEEQINETTALLQGLSDEQALLRYAAGKWSVKEVIGHIADTERIMSFRLLSVARGETAALPGYDDNLYVENGKFERQSVIELLENFAAVRKSTLHLLKSLPEEAFLRRGNANGFEVSARAIAFIMAGHERHHRKLIEERYLQSDNNRSK